MTTPIIPMTVVIPTHGRVDLFLETLASLEKQTLSAFEIIVTDDSVEDQDRKAIKKAALDFQEKTGHTANYLFSEPRLGQAKNTNQGLRVAQGELIRILHSDDLLAPRALEAEVSLMTHNNLTLEVLYHLVEAFRHAPSFDKQPQLSLLQPSLLFKSVMHSGTPLPSAIVFHRQVLNRIGGMREDLDFLCDWEFCTRLVNDQLCRQNFIGQLSSGFIGWRVHGDSTTGKLWHRHFLEHEQFMNELKSNTRLASELIGDKQSQLEFFARGVRYRYNRLLKDIAQMPAGRMLSERKMIFRCLLSGPTLRERLRPAPWTLPGRLVRSQDRAILKHRQQQPLQTAPQSFLTIFKFCAAEKIMSWGKNYLEKKGLYHQLHSEKAPQQGPQIPTIGKHLQVHPAMGLLPKETETLYILTEYNNTANLWPLRKLLTSAERLKISALNTNTFYSHVLHQCLKLTPVGLQLEIDLIDNQHLTSFGFKALLEELFPGQFTWKSQKKLSPYHHQLVYKRTDNAHSCYSAPHDGWTFGMLTTGDRRENIAQYVKSIEESCHDPFEIIIMSPVPLDEYNNHKHVRVICFEEHDDLGWITRKKNIICAEAAYSDILICHDRFVLHPEFICDFSSWGYAYGLAAPRVILKNGERGLDWAVVSSNNKVWSFGALLDYRSCSRYAYNPGGATLIRKSFWQDYPWNENLFWNEHEDVELCRRIQKGGNPILLTRATLIASADRWIKENLLLPYNDQYEVLPGQPVGEQQIRFIKLTTTNQKKQ